MNSPTPSSSPARSTAQPLLVALARRDLTPVARHFAIAFCPLLSAELALPRLQEAVAAAKVRGVFAHVFAAGLPWPDGEGATGRMRVLAELAGVSRRRLHLPPVRAADPLEAARRYEQELRAFFSLGEGALPRFDLVLLSNRALLEARGEEQHDRLVVASFDPVRRRQSVALTLPALLGADATPFATETEPR
jgi:hypothetical protein